MAYGDLKVRNLIWNTGSGDNTVVLSTLLTSSSPSWTGTATGVNLTLSGDLQVNGTTTTINTQTLDVEDHNITLGKVSSPSDTTANNGGLTLKGATDKTFNWINATDAWTSSEHIHVPDNKQLILGTASNLRIHYNATDNRLDSYGKNLDLINKNTDGAVYEKMISCIPNGAVELYYDGSKKLATESAGVAIWNGNIRIPNDTYKMTFGASADLQIYHDGSDSYIKESGAGSLKIGSSGLWLQASDYSETMASFTPNGAVELYYNNVKTFETHSNGISILGPEGGNAEIELFSDEGDDNADKFKMVVDGSVFYLQNYAAGAWETNLKAHGNSAVELFFDNDRKFKTVSSGAQVESATGDTYLVVKAEENNSSSDALLRLQTTHVDAVAGIQFGDVDDSDIGKILYRNNTNKFEFVTNTSVALSLDNSQNATFTGSVSDSKGNLRHIIRSVKSSAHTLVAADSGTCIAISSGGVTVNANVFGTAGHAVTIVNDSGSDQTITQGAGISIYNTADASTGNRVLAGRGMATIWFASGTTAYISGAGLS